MKNIKCFALALCAGAAVVGNAWATDTLETEPNDSKATASLVVGMVAADTITGNSISSSTTGLDYFRVKTAPAALGIYKHQLVITTTGTAGHTGTIRGLNQTDGGAGVGGIIGATDNTAQTSSATTTPARMNQWYGFGKEEEIYYRVTGTASTTANYVSTLSTTAVTPISGPTTIPAGTVVMSTIGQTSVDTDMWLYDSGLNAIPGAGNDDESVAGGGTGATLQSRLVRTLSPGTYYLAISRFSGLNNQASPGDDDFRTGTVLDFPNVHAGSSTTNPSDLDVSIGGTIVTINAVGPFAVEFVRFTVVDVFNTSCGTTTGIEGQNVAIRVNAHAAPSTTISSVVVDASSINPAATSVNLSNISGDVWGADVLSTVPAGTYSFSYVATDSTSATLGGTCNAVVTPSATGACCTAGSCSVTREFLCVSGGGSFVGAGTSCDPYGYTFSASGNAFEDISATGTLLATISDADDGLQVQPLPFPFTHLGNVYNSVNVSGNGNLQFGATASNQWVNVPIPNTAVPNDMLAPLWDDFDMSNINNGPGAGAAYYLDDSANGRVVFSWQGVGQYNAGGIVVDSNSFQVILYSDGNVEYRYGAVPTVLVPQVAGDTVTVGYENIGGTGGGSVDPTTTIGAGNTALLLTASNTPVCGPSCDSIDFNQDGLFPDTADIDDFISVFGGGPCSTDPVPGCADIDFNNDGLFPDTLDIDALISVFGGGPCLV